ncbi:MAG: hypothetical protein SGPRY_000559 [Prymnesium sp.]
MRLWLLLALVLSPLSSAYTIGDALTGKQKRQLRAVAGRLAAAKELRSVIVADPARSALEVSKELDMNELVRARFPHVEKKREAAALANELVDLVGDAAIAEVLGHTALLYRPSDRRLVKLDS